MTVHDRTPEVTDFVRARLSERVELPIDQIHSGSDFIELGLQSVDAVLLCGEVEDHFDVELDPSTIFQHETVDRFVADVVDRLARQ